MDLGIAGRVAIVGGSSKGLGKATALSLAREGANVTICARHADELEATAAELREASSDDQVLPVAADLAKQDDIERVVAETTRRWGRVDIAVNNVGGPPPGLATAMTDEEWRAALDLNFASAVRMNRLVLPGMRNARWGRIITILSIVIKEPDQSLALSAVARSATATYAKLLATELAPEGITVNNVLPGYVHTGRIDSLMEAKAKAQGTDVATVTEQFLGRIASGRFGRPEEVGDLICFLASERAAFITGLNIPIDGGQHQAVS